ncbi:MAG: tRNA threonylcarbamoyladenosine dehydratase [Sporomusaceae bacterium]|jgi:tRNA A37 threonylcarbamoyladenosine dehydratase|nr:tRNA threonylcarbamoyladenosine dehydratase [Sporomusaceae bacterium]
MLTQFERTALLIGAAGLEKLQKSKVAVFGIGGVGSFAAEALARVGVGFLTLVDYDLISLTNLNRQIHATHQTVGKMKTTVMKERILDINPAAKVVAIEKMCTAENVSELVENSYDYIIDAIDMVSSKISLIVCAKSKGVPIISSMGAGNKLDAAKFEVADIYQTSVCPLAKVVRQELKKRGVPALKVVYSKENPRQFLPAADNPAAKKPRLPGSVSFVPPVAGFILAGEVVKDLLAQP